MRHSDFAGQTSAFLAQKSSLKISILTDFLPRKKNLGASLNERRASTYRIYVT